MKLFLYSVDYRSQTFKESFWSGFCFESNKKNFWPISQTHCTFSLCRKLIEFNEMKSECGTTLTLPKFHFSFVCLALNLILWVYCWLFSSLKTKRDLMRSKLKLFVAGFKLLFCFTWDWFEFLFYDESFSGECQSEDWQLIMNSFWSNCKYFP